jgi:hypothetical protein
MAYEASLNKSPLQESGKKAAITPAITPPSRQD